VDGGGLNNNIRPPTTAAWGLRAPLATGFCSYYCGWHTSFTAAQNVNVPYAFIVRSTAFPPCFCLLRQPGPLSSSSLLLLPNTDAASLLLRRRLRRARCRLGRYGLDVGRRQGDASTQCPCSCIANCNNAPNNNTGADGMVSVIAHELAEMASNPFQTAWCAGWWLSVSRAPLLLARSSSCFAAPFLIAISCTGSCCGHDDGASLIISRSRGRS